MRTSKLATLLVALSLAAAPVAPALASPGDATAERAPGPRPAAPDELAAYAEREQQAKPLEDFEGGRRGRGIETGTVIIVLLVVILVLIII